MDVLAVVWHFWIAPALVGLVLLVIVATLIGYYRRVVAPRYPKS